MQWEKNLLSWNGIKYFLAFSSISFTLLFMFSTVIYSKIWLANKSLKRNTTGPRSASLPWDLDSTLFLSYILSNTIWRTFPNPIFHLKSQPFLDVPARNWLLFTVKTGYFRAASTLTELLSFYEVANSLYSHY